MLKVSASVAHKRPGPEQFSSRSYHAGLEEELPSGISEDEIRERVRSIYILLESAVQDQLEKEEADENSFRPVKEHNRISSYNRNGSNGGNGGNGGNGSGRGGGNGRKARMASQAQCKAIFAISHSLDLQKSEIIDMVQDQFGASRVEDLQMREASQFIEHLKSLQTRH